MYGTRKAWRLERSTLPFAATSTVTAEYQSPGSSLFSPTSPPGNDSALVTDRTPVTLSFRGGTPLTTAFTQRMKVITDTRRQLP
jgi:hypothetical protein